ncbi:MAG: hypothetical protein ABJB74_09480 [Gemmatimonas sp.]
MIHIKAGRALGAVSFAVFTSVNVATANAPVAPRAAGYTFVMVTKTESSSPDAAGSTMTAAGIAGPDGSVRLDITAVAGASSGLTAVGDYYISKGGKLLLIRPATKTIVDIGDLATAQMTPEIMAQITIADITATSEKVAGSETIEGRATEHLRTTIGYSMSVRGQSVPNTIVTDYWLAKSSIPMMNPMPGTNNAPASGPMAELAKKQSEVSPKPADGVALKKISTRTISVMGNSIVSTVTSEMKNLKEGDVDVSKIVVPEGYTKAMK